MITLEELISWQPTEHELREGPEWTKEQDKEHKNKLIIALEDVEDFQLTGILVDIMYVLATRDLHRAYHSVSVLSDYIQRAMATNFMKDLRDSLNEKYPQEENDEKPSDSDSDATL